MTYVLAVLLGVVAGVLAGMFGVGGGILFVPTLTWLGLTQLHAEATSLLAILPTAFVGSWRQVRYGNVNLRAATVIGVVSIAGVQVGVLVGVWRHNRYGNVRWKPAAVIGVASIGATVAGAQVAESLPESTLRKLFAVLLLFTAAQIAWRASKRPA